MMLSSPASEGTDCEADKWFDYEFPGRVKLRVWIADDPGTDVWMIKVKSPSHCCEKIRMIIDVAQIYRLSRRG
jgi:hypothetical protein